MDANGLWRRFVSSGQIADYLAYRHGQQGAVQGEDWDADEEDDNGAGAARDEDGRG